MRRELVTVPIMPSPEGLSIFGEQAEVNAMNFTPLMRQVEQRVRAFDLRQDRPHKLRIQAYFTGYTGPTRAFVPELDSHTTDPELRRPLLWLSDKTPLIILDQTNSHQLIEDCARTIFEAKKTAKDTFQLAAASPEEDIPDDIWYPAACKLRDLLDLTDEQRIQIARQAAQSVNRTLIPENLGFLFATPDCNPKPYLPKDIQVSSLAPDLDRAFEEEYERYAKRARFFRAELDEE